LPFDLIQVHLYSASRAGAVFLPLTLVIAALSRWSGGLLDRFGPRLPLTIGPSIAALGFALLALPGMDAPYWATFLAPMMILGLGLAVSVAPLTTSVINAVPAHRAGVASGINNAVAEVAALLAVAIFGAVAVNVFNPAVNRRLATQVASAEVTRAVESAHGKFVIEPARLPVREEDRRIAESMVRESLALSIRVVMVLAAALALAGAACAAVAMR